MNFYDDPDDQDNTSYTEEDDDKKHEAVKSPSVKDEEDPMSGDMPADVADIDEERRKVGLNRGNSEDPQPLGMADELTDDQENQ